MKKIIEIGLNNPKMKKDLLEARFIERKDGSFSKPEVLSVKPKPKLKNIILYPILTREAYIYEGQFFHVFRTQETYLEENEPEPHKQIALSLNIGHHTLTFFETYRLEISLVSPIKDIKDFTCKELIIKRKQLIKHLTTIDTRLSQDNCQVEKEKL